MESTDYRVYIARLRLVGCPEEVIRDIIVADVNQLYAVRMAAVWNRPQPVYWKKHRASFAPNPDQMAQLQILEQEKSDTLKALLGVEISPQELAQIGQIELRNSDRPLLFLSGEKRDAARKALQESGVESLIARMQEANPGSDPEVGLFAKRKAVLLKVLSPEELDEYEMRNSPKAQWLRGEVNYLDCSKEEFKALLQRLVAAQL